MKMQWVENKGLAAEGLPVPYPPSDEGGRTNVGYFDLRGHPELIAQVHELRGYPEFEKLIRDINRPESIFRSLRLEVKPRAQIEGAIHAHSSYVTIAFEILNWSRLEANYRDLYQQFIRFPLRRSPPDSTRLQFRPVWVNFDEHREGGVGLDIVIIGVGLSESQALAAWRSGLTAVREFLTKVSEKHIHHLRNLKPGEKTIGLKKE